MTSIDHAQMPVRKAVRRIRWFLRAFREQVAAIEAQTGARFDISEPRLVTTFVEWSREFEAQKPHAPEDRRPFVGFAAGLMLRALCRNGPLTLAEPPDAPDPETPAGFWPEGHAYVAFCLTVRRAVLEQDFHEDAGEVPELREIRTWQSFRENVQDDPDLAIAFLDLFAGDIPDWQGPALFRPRHGAQELPSARKVPALER